VIAFVHCSGEIWVVNATATSPESKVLLLDTAFPISSFGEDAAGNLYVLDLSRGKVYEILPA
jgi:hypothetical protein